MCVLEALNWDSNFFNKKIGAISIATEFSTTELTEQFNTAVKEKYELVYLFNTSHQKIDNTITAKFQGKLVDTKVIFQKHISNLNYTETSNIKSYTGELDNELIELAYLSGEYSRFKTTDDFSITDFKALYFEWIKNSIAREIADEVFVFLEKEKIVGFITVSIQNGIGGIGLIAVHPNFQGKKIGGQLINKVNNYLLSQNIYQLQVPTQKANKLACQFYLKNNFKIISTQDIYHFNLDNKTY